MTSLSVLASSDDWSAVGQLLVALVAVAGGGWALYGYRESRRLEAARWLHGIFRDFYVDDRFDDVRWLLNSRTYEQDVVPLLTDRLENDRDFADDQRALLRQLDVLLNFFEHLLYLESERHLRMNDREALFGYWFTLMRSDDYELLQRYVRRFGYEYLAAAICQLRAGEL